MQRKAMWNTAKQCNAKHSKRTQANEQENKQASKQS